MVPTWRDSTAPPTDEAGVHPEDDIPEEGRGRGREKRIAEAAQDLGEALIALNPEQLASFDLSDRLRDAIALAQSIKSHSALRRQRQFVGKLMREVDPAPIQAQLLKVKGEDEVGKARLHRAERWRERLLADGDEALTALLEEFPHADRAHLRTLMRQARDERARGAPPRHHRELFRALRDLLEALPPEA
jgi:ribosome-associated protein